MYLSKKLFLIACLCGLACPLLIAQNPEAAWKPVEEAAKPVWTQRTPRELGRDLKVSDVPADTDNALDLTFTMKCANIRGIVSAKEEDLSLVADDVLARIPNAAERCATMVLLGLKDFQSDLLTTDIGLMVDATSELHQRRYNALLAKYKELLTIALDMNQRLTMMTNARTADLQQQRIANALTILSTVPRVAPYQLPPPIVFQPPPPPLKINCTSTRSGDTTFTNCQ